MNDLEKTLDKLKEIVYHNNRNTAYNKAVR